ncbi:MAG: ABC transporter substrate-binding protein [Geitlerinemataceae cyanobacterium]
MKRRNWLTSFGLCLASLVLAVSCTRPAPDTAADAPDASGGDAPIVIGYSNWPGWWPWAIAEEKDLFAANGIAVELKWFDSYIASMEALAAGQLDGNSQTLNDTISFAGEAVNGEVAVLVNDNSAGNDKIIVTEDINEVADLKGKQVAVEEGVVDDFLLALALEEEGMSRDDVEIVGMDTGDAAAAFASGQVDAVGAFPPFWAIALEREGSKELISSADFPGAIPDLLVVTQTLIDEKPDVVQGLIDTWFDILAFMEANPEEADAIMAERAGVEPEDFEQFKEGTKMFSIEDNLKAFSPGDTMEHMPFAAEKMAEFMVGVGFIPEAPELGPILNDTFVKAYAEQAS